MQTLADIRAKYPAYKDIPDQELADKLHAKFYSDMPREDFNTKIGLQSGPPAGAVPGSKEYADWAASEARAGHRLPQVGPAPMASGIDKGIFDKLDAATTAAYDSIPVVGPVARTALETARGAVQGMSPQDVQAETQRKQEANPGATMAGTVAGTVLPFVAGGEIPIVAKALGMDSAVPLLARTGASLASSAAISAADTAARGGSLADVGRDAGIGGAIGAVIPGAGELIGRLAGAVGKKSGQLYDAFTNTDRAASKTVAGAITQDMAAGKAMSPADEAAAALNGQPIINADRYGNNVRTLARTASNTDASAKAALGDAVDQRFLTQADRATAFVKRVTGGNVNDVALQDQIAAAARQSNDVAYKLAYSNPAAQRVWTPGIKQLFQSPDFVSAIKGAERTAANDAAASGHQSVKSPFAFDPQGNISLRAKPDGSVAVPNLPFWDIVQRNLRAAAEKAYAGGDKLLGGQIKDMRSQLLTELDSAVPDFAKARKGAAAAFGAEDAIDAGRKFLSQTTGLPEARKAYAQFTPAERMAFGTGFASELIDKIGSVRDKVNVINQVFGSPAARAQVELAMGKSAATELEAFVRMEDIMQMTKQAVQGNSSTAQQLIAAGVVGSGVGGAISGWDPRTMGEGALLLVAGRAGLRATGKAVDQKVMQRVAEMLSSADPAQLQKAVQSANWSPQFRAALEAIERGLGGIVRGAADGAMRQEPLQITVNGGNGSTAVPGP